MATKDKADQKAADTAEYLVLRSFSGPGRPSPAPGVPGAAKGATVALSADEADRINAAVPGGPAVRKA